MNYFFLIKLNVNSKVWGEVRGGGGIAILFKNKENSNIAMFLFLLYEQGGILSIPKVLKI